MVADTPLTEIVVSVRYLQEIGTSRAHLYLYREDGKPLRQLTNDETGRDSDPIFSPDGETILFTRESAHGAKQCWSVEPRGGNPHPVPTPDWYAQTKSSPAFGYLRMDSDAAKLFNNASANPDDKPTPPSPDPERPPTYRAPDGSLELVLKISPTSQDDASNGGGHGRLYLMRDLLAGTSVELGQLPGFEGATNVLARAGDDGQRFLLAPPLRVAFFGLHLNSTDGDTVFALDLARRRLVRLSPNGSVPVPLPDEPAFLTLTENRYVPFGDGKHTANCSYVERWDATLQAVRYAKNQAAGVCYGASMYRPGKTPAIVTIRKADD